VADITNRPGPKERAADALAVAAQHAHAAGASAEDRARLARKARQLRPRSIAEVMTARRGR
jgi:hypothetical protein